MRRVIWIGLIGGAALVAGGCSRADSPAAKDDAKAGTGADTAMKAPSGDTTDGAAPTATPWATASTPPKADSAQTSAELLPLIDAAKRGDVDALRAGLDAGELVDQGDFKFDNTPLMYAAINGCTPCVELLLERHADINHRNSAGATALMWAAMQGPASMVQLLLQHGADVTVTTASGRSAATEAQNRTDDTDKALIIVLLEQAKRSAAPEPTAGPGGG